MRDLVMANSFAGGLLVSPPLFELHLHDDPSRFPGRRWPNTTDLKPCRFA
jgi:hypothetical protein